MFAESFNTDAAPTAAAALKVTVSKLTLGEGGECIKVELLSLWSAVPLGGLFRGLSAGDA